LSEQLNLQQWLERIEQLHPEEIELGLDRVRSVADRLALNLKGLKTVVIAGTNGKGSTVACLQAIALKHGLSVGSYTSPHLLAFNERIQLDGQVISDASLCRAFTAVDQAREGIPLTYFEFTTLAAFYCFDLYQPHLCLLEVGLGGRLDAVNIIDADVTIVTNIQLDHEAWLGNDRDSIAREKAGIFRTGVPAICAELSPPDTLGQIALEKQALWIQNGVDFSFHQEGGRWRWHGCDASGKPVALSAEGRLALHPDAVAAAIQAFFLLTPGLQPQLIALALATLVLPGRCQKLVTKHGTIVLDVAHNPAAARRLATALAETRREGRTHILFAMLADKRADQFADVLAPQVDGDWWLPQLQVQRAAAAVDLAELLAAKDRVGNVHVRPSVDDALEQVLARMDRRDHLVVTGSFYTVAGVMQSLLQRGITFE
jgi:dihydrofolate synthase/folylpolyglutamate synthase